MKSNKVFIGLTILATATLLVACQEKTESSKNTSNTVETTTSSEVTISEEERQKNLDDFYQVISQTIGDRYGNEIDEKSQEAWNESQTNIFAGQASYEIIDDYLPKELSKLNVKIDGYDNATRRLKVTVTNNYDETLKKTTKDSSGNYLFGTGTNFTLYGYSTLSGKATRVQLLSINLVEDLKAGESIHLEILPRGLAENTSEYAKSLQNPELDSKYLLGRSDLGLSLWDDAPDLERGVELNPNQFAFSSMANIYIVPQLFFEEYPSSAPTNKELEEILLEYK
ncbi:lipoprotein [Streptococcus dysgalactiae subsp. dysgalactiae]|uniref:Lipoprotein n=1 Tax=Streptococcus dysgalactiae subsp. dysgalactiae TaxID=99822 RepID=A0A380JVM0_STRDY|nr:hypothetical protein [Streptococcus dysgalactiae]SUN48778.1 lipoprotein [Streptococcus dysgalactiae subsp. dysgalactiae]